MSKKSSAGSSYITRDPRIGRAPSTSSTYVTRDPIHKESSSVAHHAPQDFRKKRAVPPSTKPYHEIKPKAGKISNPNDKKIGCSNCATHSAGTSKYYIYSYGELRKNHWYCKICDKNLAIAAEFTARKWRNRHRGIEDIESDEWWNQIDGDLRKLEKVIERRSGRRYRREDEEFTTTDLDGKVYNVRRRERGLFWSILKNGLRLMSFRG